jgi:hypothetical protein
MHYEITPAPEPRIVELHIEGVFPLIEHRAHVFHVLAHVSD